MSELVDYINKHAAPADEGVDMVFFKVAISGDPDPKDLTRLIAKHSGEFGALDFKDGQEHSYLEVGGWIGDQQMALLLLGLGKQLDLWDLYTPKTVLGEKVPQELIVKMAEQGMITVVIKEPIYRLMRQERDMMEAKGFGLGSP